MGKVELSVNELIVVATARLLVVVTAIREQEQYIKYNYDGDAQSLTACKYRCRAFPTGQTETLSGTKADNYIRNMVTSSLSGVPDLTSSFSEKKK